MEAFERLRVIVVGRAELLDGLDVVLEHVKLRYIEVFTNADLDEDGFVLVESVQGLLHIIEGVRVVSCVLSEINEV